MFGRTMVVLAAGVVITAIAVSCGSDDGDTSAGTNATVTSISKAQFINEGEKICETVPVRYEGNLQTLSEAEQDNPEKSVPKAAIPPLRIAVKEFTALGAPEGEEKEANAITDALTNAADGLQENPHGGLAGPKSSFAEFNELTKEYGFDSACNAL